MQNHDATSKYDEEISVLDILVVLSENIKLIVIGPILAAAATYGIISLLPKTYESTAWLRPSLGQAALYRQTGHLVANLNSEDNFGVFLETPEGADWRRSLADPDLKTRFRRDVKVSYTPKEDYISVSFTSQNPTQAQACCRALIRSGLESVKPTGILKAQIIEKIASRKNSLKEIEDIYTIFSSYLEVQESNLHGKHRGEIAVLMLERKNAIQFELMQLEHQLAGYGDEIFLQQPTLPDASMPQRNLAKALIFGVLAEFILIGWTLLRAALHKASNDPECASKLARISRGFGISTNCPP